MLSNDCSIELIFNFLFYFQYSWFIELQLNRHKLLLFLRFFIHQVLFFGVLFVIFASLIFDLFFLHWSDQSSLILKLVFGCDCKFPVGHIQTGHTDLLPPQFCGSSWQRGRLGVQNFSLQLIALFDLKPPSISSFRPYFFCCWLVCIIFIVSAFIDTETFPQVWFKIFIGPYPNQTYRFASPEGLWKVVARVPFFVISTATINKLVVFKAFHLVIQVCSFVGERTPKGHKGPLG